MFQSTTRLILFLVGLSLATSTVVIGAVGPLIFSVSRVSILLLLIWGLFVWSVQRRRYPRDGRLLWIAAFAAALTVSLVTSVFEGTPRSQLFVDGVQISAAIVFAPLLAYVTSDRSRLDALLSGYLISVFITSISVILGSVEGARTGGLGGDPNHFAIDAVMALPIAALFFYTRANVRWRLFLTTMVVLAVVGIILSLSRSALVALVAMFGLWMLRFRRFDLLRYVLPVGLLLVVGLTFAPSQWQERMGTMTSREGIEGDGSIMSRFHVAEYSFRAFASNPILGVGYRRFSYFAVEHRRYLKYSDPQAGEGRLLFQGQSIHNAYLHAMAEMGLMGLIPFLAILILSWRQYSSTWRLARGARGDPEMNTLYMYAIFLQLSLLGILIGCLFMSALHWKTLWFILGISVVMLDLARRRAAELQAAAAPDGGSGGSGMDAGHGGNRVQELQTSSPLDPWQTPP